MACTQFILLVVALGVMMTDLCAYGGAARNLRCRKRRSLRSDVASEVEPDRVSRELNISENPSVMVGSSDESIRLDRKDSSRKSSAPAQNEPFTDGHRSSSSSYIQSFATPGFVPRLPAPHEITRTFFPTDLKSGPSTEVIKVGRVPQTYISVTNNALHTSVVHVVSTTTELYFSYLTLTVTTGVAVTERPTVTLMGDCRPPVVTRYVKDPAETLTVTVPVIDELPPATFYFSTTSDDGNTVSKTSCKGADQTTNHGDVNLQASTYTTPRTLSSPSASGYDYGEPSMKFVHGRPSHEQKKVKRAARTFVDHYSRTVPNY